MATVDDGCPLYPQHAFDDEDMPPNDEDDD
jgi:hypothetical protein